MGEVNDIHLTLPSSSRSGLGRVKIGPDEWVEARPNFVNDFLIRLAQPIRLVDGFEYEVALLKLIYPTSAMNITDAHFKYYSYEVRTDVAARLRAGFYHDLTQIVDEFRAVIGEQANYYHLRFDATRARFHLMLHQKSDSKRAPTIEFIGDDIRRTTGLPTSLSGDAVEAWGERPWEEHAGHETIYVYTNLCRNQNVGDREAPLLAVVNYSPGDNEPTVELEYQPLVPIYVPMTIDRSFEFVKVNLRTRLDRPFPFSTGETILVLHIRIRAPKL